MFESCEPHAAIEKSLCTRGLKCAAACGLPRSMAVGASSFTCRRCQRSYDVSGGVVDLTVTSGAADYEDETHLGTTIFQNSAVAFAYERGWRQNFFWFGFPAQMRRILSESANCLGSEVEYKFNLAQSYFRPATAGNTLVDVSCGSGLFSRRFAASGEYDVVVALDFSASMLQQARSFFNADPSLDKQRLALVRADVGRLPFVTGSVQAIHAGAAIHCWPQLAAAVAEISRVLKPGGVFVGTTFLLPTFPFGDELTKGLRQLLTRGPLDPYRWWSEAELRDLTQTCGLIDFACYRSSAFILFTARKPSPAG
eukprot:SM000122S25758  [mRNA]  locus=s122:120575:122380:+ [translate_table: standard]